MLVLFIQQEDTYMIEAELFTDNLGKAGKERILILNGCGRPSYPGNGFELPGTAFVARVGNRQFGRTGPGSRPG